MYVDSILFKKFAIPKRLKDIEESRLFQGMYVDSILFKKFAISIHITDANIIKCLMNIIQLMINNL